MNVGFVSEVLLGHSIFRREMEIAVSRSSIRPTWMDVTYRLEKLIDPFLAGGIEAYSKLRLRLLSRRFHGLFFNTQTPAVFCADVIARIPTTLSIDATGRQLAAMSNLYDWWGVAFARGIRRWADSYRRIFRASVGVMAMSEWAADAAIQDYDLPADRCIVIYPSVDLDVWRPADKPESKLLRLLFVGGDFHRKGGDLLLRWMREGGSRTCTLDVVSNASRQPVDSVRFHGSLEHGQIVPLYQQADLFVLPTRADCNSRVAIEAMAVGTPVLSTNMGAIPELLGAGGEGGVFVEPGSYEALRERLNELVGDRPRLARLGQSARAHAERHFDIHRNGERRRQFMESRFVAVARM